MAKQSTPEVKIKIDGDSRRKSDASGSGGGSQSQSTSASRAGVEFQPFRRWAPWLTPTMVIVNVVMFMVTMFVNNCPARSSACVLRFLGHFSFEPLRDNPLLGPSTSALVKMGALDVNKVVKEHQVWRLVTCLWLHAGIVHLAANMLSLGFIGIRLEQEFGFGLSPCDEGGQAPITSMPYPKSWLSIDQLKKHRI